MKLHQYQTELEWEGNLGEGTKTYTSYSRNHSISALGKPIDLPLSSDPSFRGDPSRYNPEQLFLASLSSCHMLWFLHLCSVHKVVVTAYADKAEGTMEEATDGNGRFTSVVLHPRVTVAEESMVSKAHEIHEKANSMCFIANSCNFKIQHDPSTLVNP